jgi:PAS domain S-box-containing protein
MEINYISIYDTTAEVNYLFVSDSVQEVLGYTPEELIGLGGFEVTHPDERKALNVIHVSNIKNEHMSSITSYRTKHKEGHYILMDTLVHSCYDVLICTNFAVVSPDNIKHKMRLNTADEVFSVGDDGALQLAGAWNDSQEKMKELLANKYPWDVSMKPLNKQEPRFCLFINRYTTDSIIVFATKMCEALVGLDQFDCIGQSLFEYVAPKDRNSVMNQIELSKSSAMISRVRFHWIKPGNELVNIEAVISCTYDGLVLVARLMDTNAIIF